MRDATARSGVRDAVARSIRAGWRRPSRAQLLGLARRLVPPPRRRRALLLVALGAAVLCAGYVLWLRDSELVGVDEVVVTGVTTEDATKIRAALVRAGEDMTTLHVDRAALEHAVSGYPEVRAINADADFPSGLRIAVIERPPVAALVSGDGRLAVAADGTILRGAADPGALPEVKLEGPPPTRRLSGGDPFAVVQVLGAAPAPLAGRLERATRESDRGVVVRLAEGPELVFGDTTRLEAKWAAATRVLADEGADGATYIDVTIPERPAAGGLEVETLAPVAPAGEGVAAEALEPVAPAEEPIAVEPVAPATSPSAAPVEPQP